MEQIEGKTLTTERGEQVVFKFELMPSDIKWISSHSRELNNCVTYFSPFANQHGNHGGTPRDWPLLRKWKSLMLCLHLSFILR
ncbi:hypothetical protein pdam_00012173 [Pocillopora damicornis]|uniref:Uncharacterized protein n=1 Tax=Pocillopora damicornis TaxID=46731 RepID=A0A3M6UEC7_POCDA|nr:hypothetical protein pdam_00012173 [Pocillopora damicornis]